MLDVKDLEFGNKHSFASWLVNRIKGAFDMLKKKGFEFVFTSYNVMSADCYVVDFHFYLANGLDDRDQLETITEEEILALANDDFEWSWSAILEVMSKSDWEQARDKLPTDKFVELVIAGWLFAVFKDKR